MSTIEVLDGGLLTSVQDAAGRLGWRRFGVPQAGAADPFSARLANRLAGNADDVPLLEVTLLGPRLQFEAAAVMALAGAELGCRVDGVTLSPGSARRVRANGALDFAGTPRHGVRAYLAVAGGIDIPAVLGSASTDIRAGFGGLDGRPLRSGDRLAIGPASAAGLRRWHGSSEVPTSAIRILAGPHVDRFASDALERLCATTWRVSVSADRAGVRLEGERLAHANPEASELPSVALAVGSIQVPPDGQPIVMLADRPVTGGYPVLACVARADTGHVAQLGPADEVRFALVDRSEALAALRARERDLAQLSVVAAHEPDAGWSGALD